MFIFNAFPVGFSSFCHSVVFVLFIFLFSKTQNFYLSLAEFSDKEKKNESKSNANKSMRTYLLCMKKGVSSVDEKITKK